MTEVEEVMERTAGRVDASATAAQTLAEEIGNLEATIASLRVASSTSARRRAAE